MPRKNKTPIVKPKTPTYFVRILYEDLKTLDDSCDSMRHETHDIRYTGFCFMDDDTYIDFPVKEKSDFYYLVYVEYSTGDSYRREYGVHTHIALLTNGDDAAAICDQIKELYSYNSKNESSPSTYRVTLPSTGEIVTGFADWTGYFEQFAYVDFIKLDRRGNRD